MSRVDVPVLKCDGCGDTTEDLGLMAAHRKLRHSHMSGEMEWDLCPLCWVRFLNMMILEKRHG